MPVYYPEFGDFCDVAADILGITPEQIARLPNVGLAESALAAPRAGFGDVEVYPTILEKAASCWSAWRATIRYRMATSAPRSCWPASS
jgi:hypothetical protein